ncbi:hypothetical protein KCP75_06710 [Salmonella enterica subsp. enterica]|nr:hypothetical protein KCP75_06710 [Salmonella enterica subsp. enterica]
MTLRHGNYNRGFISRRHLSSLPRLSLIVAFITLGISIIPSYRPATAAFSVRSRQLAAFPSFIPVIGNQIRLTLTATGADAECERYHPRPNRAA